jgi:hypothetical protein
MHVSRFLLAAVPALLAVATACPPGDEGAAEGEGEGRPPDPPFVIVDAGPEDPPPPVLCIADAFEPNDASDAARAIEAGDDIEGRLCAGDDDWFAVEVGAGCALSATLEQLAEAPPAGGEGEGEGEAPVEPDDTLPTTLSLIAVDENDALVGTGTGIGRRKAFNTRVGTAGTYAMRVRGSAENTPYRLSVGVACGTDVVCPADDAREDNDTAATAATLDKGVPFDGAVCGSDADFFRLPVQPGCLADVRVSLTHARGDIDLQLVDIASGQTLVSSATTTGLEQVVRVFDPATTAARVFLFNGNDVNVGNAYRVVVDEICLGAIACPADDPFEDNDTRQTAKVIGRTDEVLGAVCGVDEDFFRVTPQQGCTTTFSATFAHRDGDIDLQLLNSTGGVISSATSVDDDETITFTAPNATAVTLRVFGASGAQNRYRLTNRTVCP